MNFWRRNENKVLHSEEYEKLSKRFIETASIVEELQNKFKILETNYNDLRGKFNRKLSGIKKEELEEDKEETQTINNPVILPYNGSFK